MAAAQCVGFSLLFISCLFALTSSAPLIPVTSFGLEDGNAILSNTPNSLELQDSDDLTPLSGDVKDRTPLADDVNDDDTPKSYVDASEFRKNGPPAFFADAVKPKPSFFVKKTISTIDKNAKKGREMKEDVYVPSDKLEPPPVVVDVEVNIKETDTISSTLREIVDTEVETTSTSSASLKTDGSATTSEAASMMTSSEPNEAGELPRLSPPIWLHSSLAEAMSDPLRLPMIEPYDRYDRYSLSIARDSLW